MKEKILAELKKKFEGQLSLKYMENLADRLAVGVTKEEEIQTKIDELDTLPVKVTDLQAEGDRRVSEFRDKNKTLQAEIDRLKKEKEEKPPTKTGGDDLSKEIAGLKSQLNDLVNAKQSENFMKVVHDKLGEKKIPVRYASGIKVASEEDIQTAVEKAEKEFNDARQEFVEAGHVVDIPKESGGQNKDQAIEAEIKELGGKF